MKRNAKTAKKRKEGASQILGIWASPPCFPKCWDAPRKEVLKLSTELKAGAYVGIELSVGGGRN